MAKEGFPCSKSRKPDDPCEVWESADGQWRWRVLKKYQKPEAEAKNPYARWFCAVESPITREQMVSGYELGDVYVREIKQYARRVK